MLMNSNCWSGVEIKCHKGSLIITNKCWTRLVMRDLKVSIPQLLQSSVKIFYVFKKNLKITFKISFKVKFKVNFEMLQFLSQELFEFDLNF